MLMTAREVFILKSNKQSVSLATDAHSLHLWIKSCCLCILGGSWHSTCHNGISPPCQRPPWTFWPPACLTTWLSRNCKHSRGNCTKNCSLLNIPTIPKWHWTFGHRDHFGRPIFPLKQQVNPSEASPSSQWISPGATRASTTGAGGPGSGRGGATGGAQKFSAPETCWLRIQPCWLMMSYYYLGDDTNSIQFLLGIIVIQ